MHIVVNGAPRELPDESSVDGLLRILKVRRDAIAVEINREIVPRARHAGTMLKEGDVIEVVTFVGGG